MLLITTADKFTVRINPQTPEGIGALTTRLVDRHWLSDRVKRAVNTGNVVLDIMPQNHPNQQRVARGLLEDLGVQLPEGDIPFYDGNIAPGISIVGTVRPGACYQSDTVIQMTGELFHLISVQGSVIITDPCDLFSSELLYDEGAIWRSLDGDDNGLPSTPEEDWQGPQRHL